MANKYFTCLTKVVEILEIKKPKRILEIGDNCGKVAHAIYGLLEQTSQQNSWKIEIDSLQVGGEQNNVNQYLYKNNYVNIDFLEQLQNYDAIIVDGFLDYSKESVKQLLNNLLTKSNYVIVYSPFYKTNEKSILWSLCDFPDYNVDYFRSDIDDTENQYHIFCFKGRKLNDEISYENVDVTQQTFKPLKIAYVLPHKHLTGGVKMLLEQMKALKNRGHKIIALSKGDNATTSIPDWYDLSVDEDIVFQQKESLLNYVKDVDVVVLGWLDFLLDFKDSPVPVLYWEQGNEWLFGDIPKMSHINMIDDYLKKYYSSPCELASVSEYVANIIHTRFKRKTPVILNGVDTELYCPGEHYNDNRILLVGNPYLPFKGFDTAFKVLDLVWNCGLRFSVDWVSQYKPQKRDCKYTVNNIIKPSQKELVSHYQKADIFLFTSWYEGFGMPPLEAMSCGTPVVCTNCGGTDAYIKNRVNALTAEPGDVGKLAAKVIFLLKNQNIREYLSENARKTAMEFSFKNTISSLENYLYSVINKKNT